jgi:hypothetical protein
LNSPFNARVTLPDEMMKDSFGNMVSGKEDRLRDHVAERIFHHLIRQSDPGIEWAVQEEMGDADLNGDEDLEEDMEEEDGEEVMEDDLAVDPRAGGVDVTLPQIQVDYQGLAKLLFDLGSGTDVRKANRELLYKLSKNFKDVTQEVFPLAPDLDLDQEIEKISVKKAAKRLKKFNEDYQKKNLENKIAFKAIMKEQKNKQVNDEPLKNGEENGCESSDDLTNGNSNQNGLKRSSEEEIDDEPVEKKESSVQNVQELFMILKYAGIDFGSDQAHLLQKSLNDLAFGHGAKHVRLLGKI